MRMITNRPRQGGKNTELIHSLQHEHKRLLNLLAKERDEFGKKKTTLTGENKRLRETLEKIAECCCIEEENCGAIQLAESALKEMP